MKMQNLKKVIFSFAFAVVLLASSSAVHAESIGGVYLGEPYGDVIATYENPDYFFNEETSHKYFGENVELYIWKNGLAVSLKWGDGNTVTRVGIVSKQVIPGSDRRFDYCGLNADNSRNDYSNFFGNGQTRSGSYFVQVSKKQFIWINSGVYVELNPYAD